MLLLNLTTLDKKTKTYLKAFISLWRFNHSNETPGCYFYPMLSSLKVTLYNINIKEHYILF